MPSTAPKYLTVLQTIADMDNSARVVLLPYLTEEVLQAIYECIGNVLKELLEPNSLGIEQRRDLSALLTPAVGQLKFLGNRLNTGEKKRKIVHAVSKQIAVILATAIPLIIIRSGAAVLGKEDKK